uniref:Uncharacterized protein n=1 Tax=Trichuris muris TaxID=70415 RepID=A0A5S6QAX0_TRIMR
MVEWDKLRGSNASGAHGVEKSPARQLRSSLKSLRELGNYLRRNWNSVFDFSASASHRLSSGSGSNKASRPTLPSKEQLQEIETSKLHVRNATSMKANFFQPALPWPTPSDRTASTAPLGCHRWMDDSNYKTVTLDTPVPFDRLSTVPKAQAGGQTWSCKPHAYVNFSVEFGNEMQAGCSNGADHFSRMTTPADENYRTMPLNVPLTFALTDKKLSGNVQGKLIVEAS